MRRLFPAAACLVLFAAFAAAQDTASPPLELSLDDLSVPGDKEVKPLKGKLNGKVVTVTGLLAPASSSKPRESHWQLYKTVKRGEREYTVHVSLFFFDGPDKLLNSLAGTHFVTFQGKAEFGARPAIGTTSHITITEPKIVKTVPVKGR